MEDLGGGLTRKRDPMYPSQWVYSFNVGFVTSAEGERNAGLESLIRRSWAGRLRDIADRLERG